MSATKSTSSTFAGALNGSAASFQHLSSLANDSRNKGTWPLPTEKAGGVGIDFSTGHDARVIDILYESWDETTEPLDSDEPRLGEAKVPSQKMVKMSEAIYNLETKWTKIEHAQDIRFRIVMPAGGISNINNAYGSSEPYLEFSLRELKPIQRSDIDGQYSIWKVHDYVQEILNLELQQKLCRVRLRLGELGELSGGLVSSLALTDYKMDLSDRKMAATTIQPNILRILCGHQDANNHPKDHKDYYNHSESLAMLGVDTDFTRDCTRRLADLESIIIDSRSSSDPFFRTSGSDDVDFPAFPFLINHLRTGCKSHAAIKWFLTRQSCITIQSLAESASLVNLTPAELVKELLRYANNLDVSYFDDDRQLGKDLRSFVNANSRFAPASIPTLAPSLRSRL